MRHLLFILILGFSSVCVAQNFNNHSRNYAAYPAYGPRGTYQGYYNTNPYGTYRMYNHNNVYQGYLQPNFYGGRYNIYSGSNVYGGSFQAPNQI